MTTHTPGPWIIEQRQNVMGTTIRFPGTNPTSLDGRDIAMVSECPAQGNARLIAAAPIMLAALRRIADLTCDHGAGDFCPRTEARAAIAKATGQEG